MMLNPRIKRTIINSKYFSCKIGDKEIYISTEELHLGMIGTQDGKACSTVDENINKARRAAYALMGTGFHGFNRLHPKVSVTLWDTYILHRLTYGLEVLQCKQLI